MLSWVEFRICNIWICCSCWERQFWDGDENALLGESELKYCRYMVIRSLNKLRTLIWSNQPEATSRSETEVFSQESFPFFLRGFFFKSRVSLPKFLLFRTPLKGFVLLLKSRPALPIPQSSNRNASSKIAQKTSIDAGDSQSSRARSESMTNTKWDWLESCFDELAQWFWFLICVIPL